MAESPPRGAGTPTAGDDAIEPKGASDPLFHPPGLKTRKTVMGLAPAPHLGPTPEEAAAAEARKQRVLGRRTSTIPSGLGADVPSVPPDPLPPPYTGPPPAMDTYTGDSPADQTYTGPPPDMVMSSEPTLLVASPWEMHDPSATPGRSAKSTSEPPVSAQPVSAHPVRPHEVATEVMEASPVTARMYRRGPAVEVAQMVVQPKPASATASMIPPAPTAPTAALAIRSLEPAGYSRHALSGPLDPRLVLLTEPNSARATGFRLLRDSLLAKSLPRVLAVSSAAPHDGKTTCAANLALALAEQAATRVLLVDGNFFEPELAQVFSIDRLSSAAPPETSSWLAPYKLVEIMPTLHVAGIPRAPGEAIRFEQHRFDALIDRLCRVAYDYIIIDAPALRGAPQVVQILTVADGTILAVRSGGTTASELRRAAEQIPPKKALGVALLDAGPQN